MDFSVGSCSDSWCVAPSNIGSSSKRSISHSEDRRKNVLRPSGGSELQNQADGQTSKVNRDLTTFKLDTIRTQSSVPPQSPIIVLRNAFSSGHCEAAIPRSFPRRIRFASRAFE